MQLWTLEAFRGMASRCCPLPADAAPQPRTYFGSSNCEMHLLNSDTLMPPPYVFDPGIYSKTRNLLLLLFQILLSRV